MLDKKHIAIAFIALTLLVGGFSLSQLTGASVTRDVEEVYKTCEALVQKEQCYAKAFEALTAKSNMSHAFEVLRALQNKDPEARGCHFIAHSISYAETKKNVGRWKEVMNTAPQDCSYGAVHGALEIYASTFPNGELPREEIANLCNNPDTNNCTHILGHLLLIETKDDIDEAGKLCHTLPHGYAGVFECLTGVFMERITAFNLKTHGLAEESALNWPARVPELERLCRAQTPGSMESLACWKEITHAVIVKERGNPQAVFNFCERASGEDETRECIDHSLGILASGYNFDLSRMAPICEARVKAPDFKLRCPAHLVGATLSTVPHEVESAVNYCANQEPDVQRECFVMIGNSLYLARPEHKKELAQACRLAPSEFRTLCEQGGNTEIRFHSGN